MKFRLPRFRFVIIGLAGGFMACWMTSVSGWLQDSQGNETEPPANPNPRRDGPGVGDPPPFGPGGPGPRPGGFGQGFPGGPREDLKLVKQFDKDGDKRLNAEERAAAREFLKKEEAEGRRRRGPGGPGRPGGRRGFGGRGENSEPPQPGMRLSPADVPAFPGKAAYDPETFRTFFLEFENSDWESELADFNNTDVEVPAQLTVDGKTMEGVGVHFRGASSFFMVEEGRKRSLNLSLDFTQEGQNLGGYRTFNLLNSHTDPTFLRTVLYYHIARQYIPAPKANYVRVVINGEDWGAYVSAQQFNKDWVKDWFETDKGARWKVPGSPRGRGGLSYLGDDPEDYKRIYEIKTKDDSKSWAGLIQLCQALDQTPADQLEAALQPLLNIDGALKFLALENVFINSDGYWIRSSDYNLYQDAQGRFHLVPHDANETFSTPGGPGFGRGARVQGVEVDPFTGMDDPDKPLLHKLLAVPSLRAKYAGYVRQIAEEWLDWEKLGPLARNLQSVIADVVETDTRKLYPFDAFTKGLTEEIEESGFRGPRRRMSLKGFVEERRAYLLNHPEIKI